MTDLQAFVPNNLLKPFDDPSEDSGCSFSSNGLLGGDASTRSSALESASTFGSAFSSNGLLGGMDEGGSGSLLGGSGMNALSQNESQETFPSISELLGSRSRSHMREDAPPRASSSGSSMLIPATTFSGKTLHLKRKIKKSRIPSMTTPGQSVTGLLDVPIHRLKELVKDPKVPKPVESESVSSVASTSAAQNQLWVDRYRPKRFVELLGDERVHRETLAWLKEWDWCVFKKRKPKPLEKPSDGDAFNQPKWEDEHKRPREKILLISGPPGLGKTTLAHVIAQHAGYDVMEINASDARSAQVVDDRIRPALESGSAIGSKRPVCVVIDEIDGATGGGAGQDNRSSGFVHKLLQLTFDSPKKTRKSKGEVPTDRPLLRPIICICNDLYASSLTKLRQYARIVRFNRPADMVLSKRLKYICESEGLKSDNRSISTLIGVAKGDMRSCLNTLQFVKARNQELTEEVIRGATAGMKEGDTYFGNVLGSLFAPLPKKRVKELGMTEDQEARYAGRLSADIDASGAVEKVALGCFEHYMNLRHTDPTMSRHHKASEWLLTFDVFTSTMRSGREYGLMPYTSYFLVPYYPLFQERGGGRVERPKVDWENYTKTKTNEEVYKSLSRCLRASGGYCMMSKEILQLEYASMINRIISPPLRPVNSQVTKPKEKALFNRVVDIMVSHEMQFIQERSEDGQLVYRLEPPIDVFVTYDGRRAGDIAVPRYATRQLLATEIEARTIARQAKAAEKPTTGPMSMFKKRAVGQGDGVDHDAQLDNMEDGAQDGTLSHAGRSKKRKSDVMLDPADKPPVDFFGRPILVTPSQAPSAAKQIKYKATYKFHEGNSAAVRKPVKVSSLL